MNSEQTQRWQDWADAAANAALDAQLRALYDALEQEITRRSPTCWISGLCCKFDSYGHRLYVTGLEIAWMVGRLDEAGRRRLLQADATHDGCTFQADKLCTIRELRPLGCRLFYCDPTAEPWLNDVYEAFLSRLRSLHDEHSLPYAYMEWRQGLAEAREAIAAKSS